MLNIKLVFAIALASTTLALTACSKDPKQETAAQPDAQTAEEVTNVEVSEDMLDAAPLENAYLAEENSAASEAGAASEPSTQTETN